MNALEARNHLRRLQELGEREGVECASGHVAIVPPIENDELGDTDYRIIYTSWDGLRSRDLTHINNDDFLTFMRSEPGGMVQAHRSPFAASRRHLT